MTTMILVSIDIWSIDTEIIANESAERHLIHRHQNHRELRHIDPIYGNVLVGKYDISAIFPPDHCSTKLMHGHEFASFLKWSNNNYVFNQNTDVNWFVFNANSTGTLDYSTTQIASKTKQFTSSSCSCFDLSINCLKKLSLGKYYGCYSC